MNEKNSYGKFSNLYVKLRSYKIPAKVIFIILGVVSTTWFLIRVIPKPSRAGYPCMRTAAPIMSTFIIWAAANLAAVSLFKRSSGFMKRSRFLPATVLLFLGLLVGTFATLQITKSVQAKAFSSVSNAVFTPNEPIGTGQGIYPGLVVWAWDPDATDASCANTISDPYYDPSNYNQSVIDDMLESSLNLLTNKATSAEAWDALIKHFNDTKGKGSVGYTAGETIFIKINEGSADWMSNSDLTRASWGYPITETTPGVTHAILDHLVNVVGVTEQDIWVADPRSHVWQYTYEYLSADFPDVNYGDKGSKPGRTQLTYSSSESVFYSDEGTEMGTAVTEHYYEELLDADYLINLACLKAHARAGVTLTAKNHFGSHTRAAASHLHPGLLSSEDNDQWDRTGYGKYRVQVDLMGSSFLGRNTLLFLVDGLWGGPEATDAPIKWKSSPFNNDYPSSIFISQDQVALESVCLDFLATEAQTAGVAAWHDRPLIDGVDDYLRQAASSEYWPATISYDPDGEGTPLPSLGVHEHWNNASEKMYTGNLGGAGIRLVKNLDGTISGAVNTELREVSTFRTSAYPNPASEFITIEFSLLHKSQVDIRIMDLSGRTVKVLEAGVQPVGQYSREFAISDLNQGLYLYVITQNNLGRTISSSGKFQVL